ncbi:hypothetical protein ALIPUT_01266 [Alistipes putredinis DSM 17216]|uniref:Uncharacterized protein n=1 Tax=Alistipes putredinis DSM 17216 TaxID=445970 RepID=B0MVX5_9BACT|nr:hypothetical protein ALIPUT_01266 [Alistipes putredinis DSM 17216]
MSSFLREPCAGAYGSRFGRRPGRPVGTPLKTGFIGDNDGGKSKIYYLCNSYKERLWI